MVRWGALSHTESPFLCVPCSTSIVIDASNFQGLAITLQGTLGRDDRAVVRVPVAKAPHHLARRSDAGEQRRIPPATCTMSTMRTQTTMTMKMDTMEAAAAAPAKTALKAADVTEGAQGGIQKRTRVGRVSEVRGLVAVDVRQLEV